VKTVEPAHHEFSANALYNSHGLAPWFACDSTVKAGDGSVTREFNRDGERWLSKLSYQSSNIVHPGDETPAGTEFQLETIREFNLKVARHPEQDSTGEQDFSAHIAPRWPDMEGESKTGETYDISAPDGFGEGVNVALQGSNIRFDRYTALLQDAMAAVGISGRYFEEFHEFSNVQDAERYVRVHEDRSGPVHSRDGPIASMAHLLENDRRGYRKLVQNDDDEYGENLPGYYHTVTLGQRRVREAFPDHRLPVEVKHYYAKEANNKGPNHPLGHPKVGVSLQISQLRDGKVGLDELDVLEEELDETLLSVLADAGIDVAPSDDGPFVEDSYFTPDVSESGPDPLGLNMTQVRMEQEHVVVRHLADGLTPTAWESLETLVADGGELSPADIADENDRHVGSVRRALREMDDLVETEYAKVSLRSEHVAELVHEAVNEARDATRRAADAASKAMEAAKRGLSETTSAFIAWAARHDVDVNDRTDARMKLRFHGVKSARELGDAIRTGFDVWKDAGMPETRFREAQISVEGDLRGKARAWRYL